MAKIDKPARTRRNSLGTPPSPDETLGNLNEPEVAPAPTPTIKTKKESATKTDGRSLRRTGRTEQFSTRVTDEFKKEIHSVAKATGKKYNVILEESLELYKKHIASS